MDAGPGSRSRVQGVTGFNLEGPGCLLHAQEQPLAARSPHCSWELHGKHAPTSGPPGKLLPLWFPPRALILLTA